ncbi:MAG: carboxypeptidase-like regulatory domain-containing protein [Prevotella sp.]|nr:carboxypeptidase-like regulatory domain-containing protein [Prevotella sp.]
MPEQYSFIYNGTPYIDNAGFRKGNVRYNGKNYYNLSLILDAHNNCLLVKITPETNPVITGIDQTTWFTLGDRLFLNLKLLGFRNAPEEYAELIKDGKEPVLKTIKKTVRNRTGNHNGTDIGYYDPDYKEDVPTFFQEDVCYYIIRSEEAVKLSPFSLKRALRKQNENTEDSPLNKERLNSFTGTIEAAETSSVSVNFGGIGLPGGYFDKAPETEIITDTKPATNQSIQATYKNKLYVIGNEKKNGKAILSGTVTDLENRTPLAGVVIFDEKTSSHTISDADGSYSLSLPAGDNNIHYSIDGKEELSLKVEILGDGRLDVQMPDRIEIIKAAVVSATSMENHHTTTMGIEEVSMKTASKIPTAFGEADILRSVMALPGVKTTGEASSGFSVRGGSQDQNLILFNGNTIYNPSHLFGLFSAFNPDVVEGMELYKSSIPSQYGGRISSVMTVRSKQGDQEKIKGSAGIGLLTSRLHIEGPIAKGKTSFIMAGRTSYTDYILKRLPENSAYHDGSANFYDANAGLTHRFTHNDVLSFNAYLAADSFKFTTDTSFNYSNYNASVHFRHRGDRLSFQATAGYDHFANRTVLAGFPSLAYNLDTRIRQFFIKASASNIWDRNTLSYGFDFVSCSIDPGSVSPEGEKSLIQAETLETENALEPSVYVSDTWSITQKLSVEGGLRLSGFRAASDGKMYGGPELRFSGRYSPLDNLSFKAGINTMRQYIHLISNTATVSPMDTWKLSDSSIAPTTGWQAAAGAYWTHMGTGLDFSVESYYKSMANCLDYKPGATLVMNENLSDDLVPVFGKSYGIELSVKKSLGKITGWLSYSYSRALLREMNDRGNETIANGNWYNAPYDKPHEVKLVSNWAITHRYSISVNVDYSTGRPITVPVGKYYFGGAWRMAYSERNIYRIPDYFRIDAALNIDPGHYLKAFVHSSVTIGVYNITGRRNPYSVFFRNTPSGYMQGYMLSVFSVPIPYINFNFLF